MKEYKLLSVNFLSGSSLAGQPTLDLMGQLKNARTPREAVSMFFDELCSNCEGNYILRVVDVLSKKTYNYYCISEKLHFPVTVEKRGEEPVTYHFKKNIHPVKTLYPY